MFKEMIEKTKHGMDKITHANHNAATAPQRAAHTIKDLSHTKVVEIADQFHACLPTFEKAGFKLQNLEIEIGITPKIIPHFMIVGDPSEEEQKQARQEIQKNRLMKPVLDALLKASYLHKHIKIGDLPFVGLEVHLAVVPTVRLLFAKHALPRAKRISPPPLPPA